MAERPTYKLRFLDPKKRFPSMPEQPAGRSYGVVWKVFGEDPKESCYVVEFVGKTHISLLGYVSVSGKVYKVDRPVREVPLPEDPDMELVLHESDSSIGEIMVREANGAMRACARTAGSPEGPMREQSDLGHPTVEVSVVATRPLVGLLGAPRGLEVTAHAPVESFD